MKKRKFFILLAAITAGSLLLNGCGLNLTDIQKEETTLSAEMENENLSEGMIRMYSNWYDAQGNALASATVTFSEGRDELFTGTTDENGNLELCSLPGNTTMECTITDSTGETIGKSDVVFKISPDYTAITIYPVHGTEDSERIIEVPSEKTEVRAAIFLTENKAVSFANVSPYVESADAEGDSAEGDAANAESGDTAGDADTTAGDAAPAEGADATAGDAAPAEGADAAAGGETAQ